MADIDLKRSRARLRDLCSRHRASVEAFRAEGAGPWYYLDLHDEEPPGGPDDVHHLSSSASCIESLLDVGTPIGDEAVGYEDPAATVQRFGDLALRRNHAGWKSEDGAYTYCRVRTLPLIVERVNDDVLQTHKDQLAEHVDFVWRDVGPEPGYQAIVEHDPDPTRDDWAVAVDGANEKQTPRYPPNAFLSYWGIRLLRDARRREIVDANAYALGERVALLWSRQTLAAQVALRDVASREADPQQLAWAISTLWAFGDAEEVRQPAAIDLFRAGLDGFFSQQTDGLWPRGHPLFHYPKAGNAYCFVFETLAELLRRAADDETGLYSKLLLHHMEPLVRAADAVEATREETKPGAVGWCSRHHPHRIYPESWATAAVFSFLEAFRRLVGRWSSDESRRVLGARAPRYPEPAKAEEQLRERGETWAVNGWDVGSRIGGLFLNPVLERPPRPANADPDAPLLQKDQARSAILFGPPGTSKTTLVEALAGAIGWDFIEIDASDFLSEGMGNVARRADQIFESLMELDGCVVLLDEIDELLRDRRAETSDPFGRFLTTSMLPKLAKLWGQRRVLFFANTNLIDKADPAIRRSQRFDAALFVLPPSLSRKLSALSDDLPEIDGVTVEVIDGQLTGEAQMSALAWLALVRWDQMEEIRIRIRADGRGGRVALEAALEALGKELAASDWHADKGPAKNAEILARYRQLVEGSRLDYQMRQLARVFAAPNADVPPDYRLARTEGDVTFLRVPVGLPAPDETIVFADGSEFIHVGLLRYAPAIV